MQPGASSGMFTGCSSMLASSVRAMIAPTMMARVLLSLRRRRNANNPRPASVVMVNPPGEPKRGPTVMAAWRLRKSEMEVLARRDETRMGAARSKSGDSHGRCSTMMMAPPGRPRRSTTMMARVLLSLRRRRNANDPRPASVTMLAPPQEGQRDPRR